jgi:hypothetical protein
MLESTNLHPLKGNDTPISLRQNPSIRRCHPPLVQLLQNKTTIIGSYWIIPLRENCLTLPPTIDYKCKL